MTGRRGLREAHAHLASLGESLSIASLERCESVERCLEAVRRVAEASRKSGWVRLSSARVEGWAEGRWPTLEELDGAAGGRPCVVMSFDHHAAAANSAALRTAGLSPAQRVGRNGVVCADERSGRPTGLLLEDAAYAAWDAAPAPSAQQRRRHLLDALAHLESLGYAEVHDMHSQDWLGPMLAELNAEGLLRVRVVLWVPHAHLAAEASGRGRWESELVRLGGGKVFTDGTLNARTALMLSPYRDPMRGMPRGQAMLDPVELEEAVRGADAVSLPLAMHAIGDGAVRMALDAVERARVRTAGFRVEHCELIDVADVGRFASLGVIASVQPCHLLADIEALRRYLPHRLGRVLPLRELIDSGARPGELLLFGSDAPIVGADPADSVLAATARRRAGMSAEEAIAPEQAISEQEAWAAFGGVDGR